MVVGVPVLVVPCLVEEAELVEGPLAVQLPPLIRGGGTVGTHGAEVGTHGVDGVPTRRQGAEHQYERNDAQEDPYPQPQPANPFCEWNALAA